MALAPVGPWMAATVSSLAAGACCLAFIRANPRLTGLLLIGFTLGAYYTHSQPAVLWMLASVMAGGAMAWLMVRQGCEDDFYFIPTAVALLGFLLLLGLADGLRWGPALKQAEASLAVLHAQFQVQIQQSMSVAQSGSLFDPEQIRQGSQLVDGHFGPFIVTTIIGFWGLGLWLAGRLARRLTGRLWGRQGSIMFFRIRHPYIFLLILGLILEILSSLYAWEQLSYVAWPVLIWFAIACFVEGLGVLLFMVAIRRAAGFRRSAMVLGVAGFFLLFLRPPLGVLIGLADVWFDFRKLGRIDETMDLEG